MDTTSFRLDPQTANDLKFLQADLERTQSDLIRFLVRQEARKRRGRKTPGTHQQLHTQLAGTP